MICLNLQRGIVAKCFGIYFFPMLFSIAILIKVKNAVYEQGKMFLFVGPDPHFWIFCRSATLQLTFQQDFDHPTIPESS